jgi:hypothetical protein
MPTIASIHVERRVDGARAEKMGREAYVESELRAMVEQALDQLRYDEPADGYRLELVVERTSEAESI